VNDDKNKPEESDLPKVYDEEEEGNESTLLAPMQFPEELGPDASPAPRPAAGASPARPPIPSTSGASPPRPGGGRVVLKPPPGARESVPDALPTTPQLPEGGGLHSPHSPMARTGFAGGHPGAFERGAEAAANAPGAGEDELDDDPVEDEETRAVPREDLVRRPDLVVGRDASTDDATMAVPPESRGQGVREIAAALAQTLGSEQGPANFPSSQGGFPAGPPHAHGVPSQPGQPSASSWQGNPRPPAGPSPHGFGSEPSVPSFDPRNAPAPSFGSGTLASPQGYPGGAMNQGPMNQGLAGPYPGGPQGGIPRPNPAFPPPPWAQTNNTNGTSPARVNPQVIMLIVVGTICLTIFVVGIVLFVTTKF
jgi:hypothetical protein